jgi:hypothetical protein
MKYREIYEKETKAACFIQVKKEDGKIYEPPSWCYVEWLESRLEQAEKKLEEAEREINDFNHNHKPGE